MDRRSQLFLCNLLLVLVERHFHPLKSSVFVWYWSFPIQMLCGITLGGVLYVIQHSLSLKQQFTLRKAWGRYQAPIQITRTQYFCVFYCGSWPPNAEKRPTQHPYKDVYSVRDGLLFIITTVGSHRKESSVCSCAQSKFLRGVQRLQTQKIIS